MGSFWSLILPNWLVAVGTIGAVVVALFLSRKSSAEALEAKYESMKPILIPCAIYPVWDDDMNSSVIHYITVHVCNYGAGAALDIKLHISTPNITSVSRMVRNPAAQVFQLYVKPNVHLRPAEDVHLVVEVTTETPVKCTGEFVYQTIYGAKLSSKKFEFEIPHDRQSLVPEIQIKML